MTCPYCCEEFDIEEARAEFNVNCHGRYFDNYDEFWFEQEPACFRCSKMQFNLLMSRRNAKPYRGSVPFGCASCGGDYPNCTSGCSAFGN